MTEVSNLQIYLQVTKRVSDPLPSKKLEDQKSGISLPRNPYGEKLSLLDSAYY
jgi:hypothetical protein